MHRAEEAVRHCSIILKGVLAEVSTQQLSAKDFYRMGLAQIALSQSKEAVGYFRSALELDPSIKEAEVHIRNCLK